MTVLLQKCQKSLSQDFTSCKSQLNCQTYWKDEATLSVWSYRVCAQDGKIHYKPTTNPYQTMASFTSWKDAGISLRWLTTSSWGEGMEGALSEVRMHTHKWKKNRWVKNVEGSGRSSNTEECWLLPIQKNVDFKEITTSEMSQVTSNVLWQNRHSRAHNQI